MQGGPTMVSSMEALVVDRPSGLVTVIVRSPGAAQPEILTFMVILVMLEKVMLLTVTPPPLMDAAIWLGYPGPPVSGPGSKNSEPAVEVPVMTTSTDDWPAVR